MSAVNCFVEQDRVHLFTDGGFYDLATMTLEGTGNKVAVLPQYKAVIAATGFSFIAHVLSYALVKHSFASFDDLVAGWSDYVRMTLHSIGKTMPTVPTDWDKFEVILAGWSGRLDAPRAFHLQGHSTAERSKFDVKECSSFQRPAKPGEEPYAFDASDAVNSGLCLMREQRRTKYIIPGIDAMRNAMAHPDDRTDSYNVVAGFCQYTTVEREGITTKILEKWPDVIGARISV